MFIYLASFKSISDYVSKIGWSFSWSTFEQPCILLLAEEHWLRLDSKHNCPEDELGLKNLLFKGFL